MATFSTIQEMLSAEDAVPSTMPLEQYLRTVFHPDCDFVNGSIEERNVGELEHSWVQKSLMRIFLAQEGIWGVELVQECRLQVAEARFRIPDSMVLSAGHKETRIIHQPPLICLEVISAEDTWKRLTNVLRDYLSIGVRHIWAFDPDDRTAYRFDADGLHPVMDAELTIPGTEIRISIAEVFALLPRS